MQLTPEETAQVIDKAADYIELHGWTQGTNALPTGEVCMRGALLKANVGSFANDFFLTDVIRDSLKEDYPALNTPYSRPSIPAYNDHFFDHSEQAIAGLRRAAQRARGEDPGPLPRNLRLKDERGFRGFINRFRQA